MKRGERIAVTGVGAVSALGTDAPSTFARLCAGDVGIREVSLFDTGGLANRLAAEASAPLALSRSVSSRTDALALAAAREALARAGFSGAGGRLAVAVGGTAGGMLETEAEMLAVPGVNDVSRARRLLTHPLSTTAEVLASELGPVARSTTVCSACSSGATAVVLGAHWLRAGLADAVLVGGADGLCRMTFAGFAALGVMDPRPCRPFAVDRAGLSLGEGAGFLLLEPESRAERRGAPVLGWLSGWALGAEAHHLTHPEPSGDRAARLLRAALDRAGLEPSAVDYVNAHGTGTRANDAMEAAALVRVFGDTLPKVRVSSSKAQLGHTLGAAGALEAVISVLCLEQGSIVPTAGLEVAEVSELSHVRQAVAAPLAAVVSNSFGFGGLDAVLVFEHRDAKARAVEAAARPGIVVTGAAIETSPRALESLDPQRSRRFDELSALTTRAAELALAESGQRAGDVGLVAGSAYGSVERTLRFMDRFLGQNLNKAAPAEFPHLVPSGAAGNAAIYLGLTGPVFSVCERETSGESAFTAGQSLLELGACSAVLVGAAEQADAAVSELERGLGAAGGSVRRFGAGFLLLERDDAPALRAEAVLARLVAHDVFDAKAAPNPTTLSAPAEPERSLVLTTGPFADFAALLAGSAWERVEQRSVDAEFGRFEALGAVALAVAVQALREGASEVLVLGGASRQRYATRWARPRPP